MLRSEVPWFPRFIRIFRFFFQFMNELDRDGLQDMDYDVMKQVIQCEGKREVWFRGRIQAYEELAQGLVPDRRQKKRQRLHLVNFVVFFFLPLKGGYKRFLEITGKKRLFQQVFLISSYLVRSIRFRNTLASI